MKTVIVTLAVCCALALTGGASASTSFQSYRNPAQAARLFQAQLNADRAHFKNVHVHAYNPTLLLASGYVRQPGTRWFKFSSRVYKVSTYRLLMVTKVFIPGVSTPPTTSYVDLKFAV